MPSFTFPIDWPREANKSLTATYSTSSIYLWTKSWVRGHNTLFMISKDGFAPVTSKFLENKKCGDHKRCAHYREWGCDLHLHGFIKYEYHVINDLSYFKTRLTVSVPRGTHIWLFELSMASHSIQYKLNVKSKRGTEVFYFLLENVQIFFSWFSRISGHWKTNWSKQREMLFPQ